MLLPLLAWAPEALLPFVALGGALAPLFVAPSGRRDERQPVADPRT